jgi:hypothetical protein
MPQVHPPGSLGEQAITPVSWLVGNGFASSWNAWQDDSAMKWQDGRANTGEQQ